MSERERQILYDLTYMWNLKKQNKTKHKTKLTDKEVRFAVTRGERIGKTRVLEKGGQKVKTSSYKDK